jgi:hypothetical protein
MRQNKAKICFFIDKKLINLFVVLLKEKQQRLKFKE